MWIETDLEPDDVLALYILPLAKYYVVGEGNANVKYNRMLRYCKILSDLESMPNARDEQKIEFGGRSKIYNFEASIKKLPTIPEVNEESQDENNTTFPVIIQGIGSDKEFSLDGKEFDNLQNETGNENYLARFVEFATSPNPVMFSFKPMRELLNEYAKNPEYIKQLVSNITLYVYGSFNFRCLASLDKTTLLDLLSQFKKICIYESYFVSGNNNSMNKSNAPALYKYLSENKNEYVNALTKLTYNWNKSILDDMIESLKDQTLDEYTRSRHQKVVDSITGNEEFQYVIADFGLAAVYQDVEAVPITNLKFENYTTFDVTDQPTNMYVYKDIPTEKIEELVIKKWKN